MSSRFLSGATAALKPYVPGEQPQDKKYIKLNTNECPYPPSPLVEEAVRQAEVGDLRLYPDPDAVALRVCMAKHYNLAPDQVLACGGSDEALAFAFMAFFDAGDAVVFPDITYGFYKVYADLFNLQAVKVPLWDDFTVDMDALEAQEGHIFLANPNAPTGIAVSKERIEALLQSNPHRLVVVDEAYVDFAPGYSCIDLIDTYDNLLVIQTFSKSRSLAGMRLGAAFGQRELIEGMNRIRYSFNPYNLDRISMAVAMAAVQDKAYLAQTVDKIINTRQAATGRLTEMGCTVLPSDTNFLFVSHPCLQGDELYSRLRDQGILVRYFPGERTGAYVRVTIGTDSETEAFLQALEEWL